MSERAGSRPCSRRKSPSKALSSRRSAVASIAAGGTHSTHARERVPHWPVRGVPQQQQKGTGTRRRRSPRARAEIRDSDNLKQPSASRGSERPLRVSASACTGECARAHLQAPSATALAFPTPRARLSAARRLCTVSLVHAMDFEHLRGSSSVAPSDAGGDLDSVAGAELASVTDISLHDGDVHESASRCSYCHLDSTEAVVRCTTCSRWFCSASTGSSGSHIITHLVRSRFVHSRRRVLTRQTQRGPAPRGFAPRCDGACALK